jgi:predicted DNA-binding protein (MmcQ/YjbR family)
MTFVSCSNSMRKSADNAESLSSYCLSKSEAEAGYPFGPGVLVMKVGGKIFAIIGEDEAPVSISLKCEPEIARVLRASYGAVKPGYHLNKRHWNTVTLDRDAPLEEVFQWIDDSYDLVVDSLPRRARPNN